MEIDLKVHKGNLMYVPEGMMKVIGSECKGIVNCITVTIAPHTATYKDILESIEVTKKDIELRMRMQSDAHGDADEVSNTV